MEFSEQIDKIAPVLAKLQAEAEKVAMTGRNDHDRYNYANLGDYQAAIGPLLTKHKLSMVASEDKWLSLEGRVTSYGKPQNACAVMLSVTLLHESGQWVRINAWGEGQDRADKSTYKATTGARKYACAQLFNLVTHDDPEADTKVGLDKDGGKPQASDKSDPLEDL